MTLTLSLNSELERRLSARAAREGMQPADYALHLLEQQLSVAASGGKPDLESIRFLEDFERKYATDDPAEIARQKQEGEEFMRNLARNRTEMEGANARKLWP